MLFTPLTNFFSEPFDSHYVKGLRYTVRPDNLKLAVAAERWRAQGLIAFVDPHPQPFPARLGGQGKVG